MYDFKSYLGAMSSGLVSNKRLEEAKFGKKKKNKVPSQANFHQQFHISWNIDITEDDLP